MRLVAAPLEEIAAKVVDPFCTSLMVTLKFILPTSGNVVK
ncbi:hypothetical protein N627_0878 [Levilactobacillus brevis]|nr:hypothetical protein N627_0878 [Levilactobacillus brevis]